MYTISSTVLLRGRRGTCGTRFALVAGVALGDIHGTCAWHVWHLATLSWLLRGSRGTCGMGWLWCGALGPRWSSGAAALCVAGVALGDIHDAFVWQVWHLLRSQL